MTGSSIPMQNDLIMVSGISCLGRVSQTIALCQLGSAAVSQYITNFLSFLKMQGFLRTETLMPSTSRMTFRICMDDGFGEGILFTASTNRLVRASLSRFRCSKPFHELGAVLISIHRLTWIFSATSRTNSSNDSVDWLRIPISDCAYINPNEGITKVTVE